MLWWMTWEKLQRHHEDKSSLGRFNAYEDLFNIRKKEDEGMEELIVRVSTAMKRVKASIPGQLHSLSLI